MIVLAATIDADVLRLRDEFLSAPALCLTVAQVARLLDLRVEHAAEIVTTLKEEGWLIQSPSGRYRRPEPPLA